MPVRPRPANKPHPFEEPLVISGLSRPKSFLNKQGPAEQADHGSMKIEKFWNWENRPAVWVAFADDPDTFVGRMFDPDEGWVVASAGEIWASGSEMPAALFAEMFPEAASKLSNISRQDREPTIPSL